MKKRTHGLFLTLKINRIRNRSNIIRKVTVLKILIIIIVIETNSRRVLLIRIGTEYRLKDIVQVKISLTASYLFNP